MPKDSPLFNHFVIFFICTTSLLLIDNAISFPMALLATRSLYYIYKIFYPQEKGK